MPAQKNALTIDVEEWHDTFLFSQDNPKKLSLETRLEQNIEDILAFLKQHHVKATFFVLGRVAQRYPLAIRSIIREGHEVSSHGYEHRFVFSLSPEAFEQDVSRSLNILKKVTQTDILGYRAPTWSLTMRQYPRAFETLQRLGLRYDSSLYHFGFNRGGQKLAPHEIVPDFIEFPPSTTNFIGCSLPFAGGTFLRFLSLNMVIKKIGELNQSHKPGMIYFHSWEFDGKPPAHTSLILWKRFIMYHGMGLLKEKISRIIKRYHFCPIKSCLELN